MSGFHKKGTNYFPTPPEIGRLMSLIVGSQSSADFYEPCCGSGINAIHWMENLIENHGPEALREASIYGRHRSVDGEVLHDPAIPLFRVPQYHSQNAEYRRHRHP